MSVQVCYDADELEPDLQQGFHLTLQECRILRHGLLFSKHLQQYMQTFGSVTYPVYRTQVAWSVAPNLRRTQSYCKDR